VATVPAAVSFNLQYSRMPHTLLTDRLHWLVSSSTDLQWLFACCDIGVDIGKQCPVDRAARQSASASVCRETGENCPLYDQREVVDSRGSG